MEWISVKDEMPEYNKPVLLIKKSNLTFINWLYGYGKTVFTGYLKSKTIEKDEVIYSFVYKSCGDCSIFTDITHWMPLPKPPTK